MTEEQKIFAGKLFCPGDPALRALKLKAHNLCTRYNATFEDETEIRTVLLSELFGSLGAGSFLQGPIYVHYGCHTTIGDRFFGNFNLTIQDDARVTIGNDCNFGPGATIVTPVHPMLPERTEAAETARRQRKTRLLRKTRHHRRQLLVRRKRDGLSGRNDR